MEYCLDRLGFAKMVTDKWELSKSDHNKTFFIPHVVAISM
jgi:hypothetical protein